MFLRCPDWPPPDSGPCCACDVALQGLPPLPMPLPSSSKRSCNRWTSPQPVLLFPPSGRLHLLAGQLLSTPQEESGLAWQQRAAGQVQAVRGGGVRLVPGARCTHGASAPQQPGGQGHRSCSSSRSFSASTASAGPAACAAPPPASVCAFRKSSWLRSSSCRWPCCSRASSRFQPSASCWCWRSSSSQDSRSEMYFSFSSLAAGFLQLLAEVPVFDVLALKTTWALILYLSNSSFSCFSSAGSRRCGLLPISSLGIQALSPGRRASPHPGSPGSSWPPPAAASSASPSCPSGR